MSSSIEVENLFRKLDDIKEEPDLVIYNPSSRVRGPIEELDIEEYKKCIKHHIIWCFFSCSTIR